MKKLLLFFFAMALGISLIVQNATAQVSVTATAGTAGPTSYATVNDAFAAINAGTHQGNVTISVTDNTTEPATPVPLLKSGAPSSYTSVLIIPVEGDWTINSAAVPITNRGVIELNGADNVTIDGDPDLTGSRHLSIVVATNTIIGTTAVRFSSNSATGLDGADNCTLKNCIITGGRSSATSTTASYGFVMSNSTSLTTGAYKSLNTKIENNLFTRAYRAIHANGTSATYLNADIQILNNTIGSDNSALNIGQRGIFIAYSASVAGTGSAIISGNDIRAGDYGTTGYSSTIAGIEIGTVNAGCLVTKNNIHDLYQPSTSGYGAHGIYISGSATNAGIDINNNFIRDCKMNVYQTSATSSFIPTGIYFSAGATLVKINYNTISMGAQLGSGVNYSSFCVDASVSGVTIAEFQNNILVNTHTSTNAFGFYCINTANISGGTVDHNDYYCPGGHVGYYNALARTTLADWQNATGKDGNSISADPGFISATDLHISALSATVNNMGIPVTGIVEDFDGDPRDGLTPDIGADEYSPLGCTSAEGGTISPESVNTCEGVTYNMSTTGSTAGGGITYQWEVSPEGSGVDFTDVTGGNGAATTSYTTAALTPGTWYYRLKVTCDNGPATGYSNELALTVYPTPTVTVDPVSAVYCPSSGIPVTLTADGADTYSWSPAAGLDATTGAVVNASPSATTTYTVTGTDANNCSSMATANVFISTTPVVTATATPEDVCLNGSSQLLVSAYIPTKVRDMSFTKGSGAALDPMTGATQVIGSGIDDTPTAAPANIGFTFNYDGVNYTQYSVSPDGWVLLGGATAVSQYSNSVTSTTNIPKLYPYWDDVATGTTGNVQKLVTGAAPNRIFIVQWFVTIPRLTTGPANSTMQAWLYEGSNIIEFRYGTMGPASGSASVGLSGNTPASNFNCITVSTGTNSTITANNANSVQPSSGTIYTFTPPVPDVLWTPNTFLDFDNIVNPLASNITETTVYTVTAITGGCSAAADVTVSIGAPLACTNITSTASCGDNDFTVSANTTGGGGTLHYAWSDGLGGVYTDAQTITANLPGGDYTFSVTVTDGCASSCSMSEMVSLMPSPGGIASGPATGLTYQTLNYSVSGYSGTPDFQWQFATALAGPYNNFGPNADQVQAVANAGTVFYIRCILTDTENGCSTTTNVITTVVAVSGDNVCEANPIVEGVNGPFTNTGATAEPGEASPPATSCTGQTSWCSGQVPGNSVWFTFVAPPSGRISINFGTTATWDSQLALWSAPSCDALLTGGGTLLAANDDATGSSPYHAEITPVCVTPGVTYYIQVDGYGTTTNSAFDLVMVAEPATITASVSAPASPFCLGSAADVTFTGSAGATVTYNINGGAPQTTVLTGGTSVVNTGILLSDVTYNLVSVTDGACTQAFTNVSATVTTIPAKVAPFMEDFESPAFAPDCWTNTAVAGSFVWARSTAASGYGAGTASAFANFFNQAAGTYELKTMGFDISSLTTPTLRFSYAYATYVVEIDQMDVYSSTDYGTTWQTLLNMPGGVSGILNTAGATEDAFVPSASQWATQILPLPGGTNMLKFTAISAYGNNLYLDNIAVSEFVPEFTTVQNVMVGNNMSECFNATNTITVAGTPTTFTVENGGSATFVAGQKISFLPGTTVLPGGYLWGYIAPAGPYCGGKSVTIPAVVAGNETMPQTPGQTYFTLYPNPTNGNFTLIRKGDRLFGIVNVEVYNMRGERVMTGRMIGEQKREFSFADMPDGLYFVKVVADDYVETIKLVKTR